MGEVDILTHVLIPLAFVTFITALIITVVCCFQYKALALALEDINLEDNIHEKKWGGPPGGEHQSRSNKKRMAQVQN